MKTWKNIKEASQILCDRWNGGYSVSMIREVYIKQGIWMQGVHYVQANPGGKNKRYLIDVEAVNQFILNPRQAIAS